MYLNALITDSLQRLIDAKVLSFYGWWEFGICLFAFVALMGIWWHLGRKRTDFGQIWLAISVLLWSVSGLVEVYYAGQFSEIYAQMMNDSAYELAGGQSILRQQYQGWQSIISLFNSLTILLALPWFRYIPARIEPIIKSKYWFIIIGLPFLFSLVPTISKMLTGNGLGFIIEFDVYFSILTLIFLGYVLWESFAKRRLMWLAWLAIASILITFIAQIYKFIGTPIDLPLFSAIFKTSLVMIFFALALSWVKELAENLIPNASNLFLKMQRIKNDQGKFENQVMIKGVAGKDEKLLLLTPAMYDLLLKFAQRKMEDGEDWLEIKPKSNPSPNKNYDITDHNQIKRLLNSLLDGIFGKDEWSKNEHEIPLKAVLFEMSENRERKIRLSLPAGNITISKG